MPTPSPLLSDQVRSHFFLEKDGNIDVDIDHYALLLSNLELENKLYCYILTSKGFDGDLLRLDATRFVIKKNVAVTWPQTLEQVKAVANAKIAGQFFHVTGGNRLNSDEYFKSRAFIDNQERIKDLVKDKELTEDKVQSIN